MEEPEKENKKLQAKLADGSKIMVEQSKSAAVKELQAAKDQYKKAFEEGDTDKIVAAQEAIAKAAVRVDKTAGMRPIKPKEPEFTPPPPQQQAAPQINPRTKEWLDDNQSWFGKDEEMTSMAMGLDKKLQREYGAAYIGSDEYFRTIDATMRRRFPEHFDDGSEEVTTSKRVTKPDVEEAPRRATRPANVVAPATRSTPPGRIRLKQSEVATARRLGVPIEEYARQVALLRNGE